jgi:hypothetical protein
MVKSKTMAAGLPLLVKGLGLALIMLAKSLSAQETAINLAGMVVDAKGQVVAGATIQVLESPLTTLSDAQGRFVLQGTLSGIIQKRALPGGLRLSFKNGHLNVDKPSGQHFLLEWISVLGQRRILIQSGNEATFWIHKDLDLDAMVGQGSGIFWLRLTYESRVSSFQFWKSAGSTGILRDGYAGQEATHNSGFAKMGLSAIFTGMILQVSASGFLDKRFVQAEPIKSGLSLALLPVTSTLFERSRDFLGSDRTFRLAFLRKESGISRKFILNYVDMAEMTKDTMPVHAFADSRGPDTSPYGAFAPSWSPDGNFLAYEWGWENLTTPNSRVYVQPLKGPRIDGPAFPATNPRWWTDGKDTALVWCTTGGQGGWLDTAGATLRQKYSAGTMMGPIETLTKGSYNGGLSPDGRYLATGYPFGVMLDRTEKAKRYFHIYPGHPKAKDGSATDSLQVCNASISPSMGQPGQMLFLDFGIPEEPTYANIVVPKIYAQHRMILIGDFASEAPGRIINFLDTPALELTQDKTWDDPEWTNHPDFVVATTRDPDGDMSIPSEPKATQPDIYLIKISTKESLRIFTGGSQTLPVAWISP